VVCGGGGGGRECFQGVWTKGGGEKRGRILVKSDHPWGGGDPLHVCMEL